MCWIVKMVNYHQNVLQILTGEEENTSDQQINKVSLSMLVFYIPIILAEFITPR